MPMYMNALEPELLPRTDSPLPSIMGIAIVREGPICMARG